MPRAFITGATGFVGGALLHELLRRGWDVSALVRPGADTRNLGGTERPFDRIPGDLGDRASLERGMSGCDAVFHVAARYSLWNPRPREIYRDNVEGTRNVLEAARRASVKRIVYTSTVGTIHIPRNGRPGDETRLCTLAEARGHYKRSKLLAEEEARRFAAAGLPVIIVHPSAPVGPFDVKPTPTGRMIVDFLLGKMVAYIRTGLNIVGVEDVAVGHVLACERGRPGESYILGGENMTLIDILNNLSGLTGIPAPRIRIPRSVLLPVALGSEAIARATGGQPLLSLEALGLAGKLMFFSSAKAERELGYRPGNAGDALARAVAWFVKRGYAPAPPRTAVQPDRLPA